MLKIGCHLSVSRGYLAMAQDADKIGANVFQFFSRNPRGGAAKPVDEADIRSFLKFAEAHGISQVLVHAPYTLNPCADRPAIRQFTRETLADDLRRMELLPGNLYNLHPGNHVGQGAEQGIALVAETLNAVLKPGLHTTVLLETMAGKGSEIGGRFEELRAILDRTELSASVGICLDTCHVFDGGYDIVGNLDGVLEEFGRVIGRDRLKAVHLNDSKNTLGSRKDRHEVLGGGAIGIDAVARIVNHPFLRELPFILETPNDLDGYAAEITLVKSLYDS